MPINFMIMILSFIALFPSFRILTNVTEFNFERRLFLDIQIPRWVRWDFNDNGMMMIVRWNLISLLDRFCGTYWKYFRSSEAAFDRCETAWLLSLLGFWAILGWLLLSLPDTTFDICLIGIGVVTFSGVVVCSFFSWKYFILRGTAWVSLDS